MHEDECEKEIYEGATCTCDVIRSLGEDSAARRDESREAAELGAAEDYEGPAQDW